MASTVTCGHPRPPKVGRVQKTSAAKLKVDGQSVLLARSIVGASVSDCGTTPASDASGVIAKPCLAVSAVTDGTSLKLMIGGEPIMLETLGGSTDGIVDRMPQQALSGRANQSKLQVP